MKIKRKNSEQNQLELCFIYKKLQNAIQHLVSNL